MQKATQDTLDSLEAEGRIEALVRAQAPEMPEVELAKEPEVNEPETPPSFSVETINTRAYLLWLESGRPDGADLSTAAREWLLEAHANGR